MRFPNMSNDFPHLDTVNVNQYKNEFDYSRYNQTQMRILICSVPWDMGEAHLGNRSITGIGNVVHFGTKERRDAWFFEISDSECYRFESKYRDLHREGYIDVPLPFDIAAKYNYMVIEYSLFANDGSPIKYEGEEGVRKWFYFIREVEYLAPSTTRLHIMDDAFQTWIYDIDISGMMLERGHAPMLKTKASEYLNNPIENATDLLADDVNYGDDDGISKKSHEVIFNAGNMMAVIFTTANVRTGSWGSKASGDWGTPGLVANLTQGMPAYFAFAMAASRLAAFLINVAASYPQFMQTVKAVAFISSDLITLGATFSFANVSCYRIEATYKTNDLISSLAIDDFDFPSRYKNIAKLYTYPYSYISIYDENGSETRVKIESTSGMLKLHSSVSLVFPWLNVSGHIEGIGKASSKTISFSNVTQRNMPMQGNWYETLRQWNIPTFGVYQDAGTNNDYLTYYDRAQSVNDYLAVQSNDNASADTMVSNADLQIAANDAITARSNESSQTDTDAVQAFNQATQAWQAGASRASANNQIEAAQQSAAISIGSTAVASMVQGGITLGPGGALAGLVGGLIGGIPTGLQTAVSTNLTETQTETQIYYSQQQVNETNQNSEDRVGIKISATEDTNDIQNDYIEASTANNAATQKANASRTANNAQAAIDNRVRQSALAAPMEFGAYNSGDLAANRPMGLFATIVTQQDCHISMAGDEFLRYGYMLNKYWPFDNNWNLGKYFTYWKLSDFWVNGLNVPDMYVDRLRFFLYGGVTIWNNPDDIGKRSIYDNFD